jgi:hypothetical protein
LDHAKHWVEKVSQYLFDTSEKSSLPGFLFQLSNYCLCERHMKDAGHAKGQWWGELKTRLLKDKFVSLLKTKNRWPPPPRILEFRACSSSKDFETAEEAVDRVLKSELKGADKLFLYVMSSNEAEGKFKIGVSKKHPTEDRSEQHHKCYPNAEVIRSVAMPEYAHRVEKLLLAQFKEHHFELLNPCWVQDHGRHREWLEVEQDILFERISEWEEFFITRPHGIKPYKNGRFNRDAEQHSPHRNTPEKTTQDTPMKNSRPSLSRTPTPCNGSSNPYSTTVEVGNIGGSSPKIPADFTPTKSGDGSSSSSSHSSLPLNDDPIPFSITGGNKGKVSGKLHETKKPSTPLNARRRSSRGFLALSDDSPVPSSERIEDKERTTGQSPEMSKDSTPTKPNRRLSPRVTSTSLDKTPKTRGKAKDKIPLDFSMSNLEIEPSK